VLPFVISLHHLGFLIMSQNFNLYVYEYDSMYPCFWFILFSPFITVVSGFDSEDVRKGSYAILKYTMSFQV